MLNWFEDPTALHTSSWCCWHQLGRIDGFTQLLPVSLHHFLGINKLLLKLIYFINVITLFQGFFWLWQRSTKKKSPKSKAAGPEQLITTVAAFHSGVLVSEASWVSAGSLSRLSGTLHWNQAIFGVISRTCAALTLITFMSSCIEPTLGGLFLTGGESSAHRWPWRLRSS